MKKRVLSILLAVCMVLPLLPMSALAAEAKPEFETDIDDKSLLIGYNGPGGAVTIPSSITVLGSEAFRDCTNVTSVVIPDSVTYLNWGSFMGCTSMTDITIPNTIDMIGDQSFQDCTSLTSVTFPSSLMDRHGVGWGMFWGCTSLATATILKSAFIDGYAFRDCISLAAIYIPDNMEEIYPNAFFNCPSLTDVYYAGSEEEWNKIDIDETGNEALLNATIHFNAGTIDPGPNEPETSLAKTYNGDFWFRSDLVQKIYNFGDAERNSLSYPYYYDDAWFFRNSSAYQHGLVKMSIRAAMAAFDTGTSDPARNIKELMGDLDFTYDEENSIHYPNPTTDTIGYAIGSKNIKSSDGNSCSVVLVAVRGAGYGTEWGGNFNIGTGDEHDGFGYAASQVMHGVENYLEANEGKLCDNVKVWVVGYSRAAATANLVAQRLDDGAVRGIRKNNVFAFCFECPQNSVAARFVQDEAKYDNIVNIINPIDFVPKVPMSRWGYRRYGKNYYLPSKETHKDYRDRKEDMVSVYRDILIYNNNQGNVEPPHDELWTEGLGQASTLDDFMNNLADDFGSRSDYFKFHQEDLVNIAAKTLGGGGDIISDPAPFMIQLLDLGSLVASHPFNTAATVFLFTAKGSYAARAHYPELCLSWIDSLKNGLTEDEVYKTVNGQEYRKVFINCPVDVTVRDSQGQVVAQITGDEAQEIEDGLVAYIDDDGQKIVILPPDEDYTVDMRATDSGTVTYTATEYNFDSASTEKITGYYQVDVAENDTLAGVVESLDETSSAQYPLYLNGSAEPLTPSVEQSGDSVQEFLVELSVSGNGTAVGGGSYVCGEFAKVTAAANSGETFLGWYVDGSLVSSEEEYRFLVDDNIRIEARFTGKAPEPVWTNPFTDVPSGAWYYDAVKFVSQNSLMNGIGDNQFAPESSLSRAMLAQILYNKESKPAVTGNSAFPDVAAGQWYTQAIIWASKRGIVSGYSNGQFGPNDNITREQLASMLWRYAGKPSATGTGLDFSDAGEISGYAQGALQWAVDNGIMKGKGDGRLDPKGSATRAEAAQMLKNFMGNVQQ